MLLESRTKRIQHELIDRFCLIAVTKSATQDISVFTERLLRPAQRVLRSSRTVFENHCSASNNTSASYDATDLAVIKPRKHHVAVWGRNW